MSKVKGHLRLVDPLPPEPEDGPSIREDSERYATPAGHPSTWHWPSVDTGTHLRFDCPVCERVYFTDRPVQMRWCTGNTLAGARTHRPTEMVRTELSD